MAKILVVEDDKEIQDSIKKVLELEHHQVEAVDDGGEGLFRLTSYFYDLALLDWQLPSKDGVDILREFRDGGGKTPIIMLTGKSSIDDKEHGLDAGADDYLTKPFSGKELAARIRALLRRPALTSSNVLKGMGIELDVSSNEIRKNGELVELLPREVKLLEFLMRNPNRVFEQDAILNRVWPSDSDATSEALRSTVKRLRKKIDPDGEIIRTVHGVGYVFRSM
jgi:DNA-binding response OmpR family regulator